MESFQLFLGVILLIVALLLHLISLYNGSVFNGSQQIYQVQGAHKELSLPVIYRLFGYFLYLPYLMGVVLLFGTVEPAIQYIFMSIALTRLIYIFVQSRQMVIPDSYKQSQQGEGIERFSNIGATIHILYILFSVFTN